MALAVPGYLFSAGPSQEDIDEPEISDVSCSFLLDHDGDGVADEPFEAESDNFVPQETPVVGDCTFNLTAPDNSEMLVESELEDWEGDVSIKRQQASPDHFLVSAGGTKSLTVGGSVVVNANLRGVTPRGAKSRTLPEEYRHEVQIPEEARLLVITVTDSAQQNDRLEISVQSTTWAYITAQRQLDEAEPETSPWVTDLAQEWLAEGYPQVSESIITQSNASEGGNGINWWMWFFLGAGFLLIISVGIHLFG